MQGGVGDYTRALSQALGRQGVDVHVLTNAQAGGDHLRTSHADDDPTVYPVIEARGWSLWGHTQRLVHSLRPDVVHIQYQSAAYGLHPAVNYLASRLRMARSRPLLFTTFHDLLHPYLFPKAGPLRWRSVLDLARSSDGNVITNATDWQRITDAGVQAKLFPIPIGSNIRCQPPPNCDRECQRARWGARPDSWLLAYFGFLNAGKGGETLIRALGELVRWDYPARLLMVGGKVGTSDPTNADYLAKVEGMIRDLHIEGLVQWTGFTEAGEVSANLMAADCAVLPFREGASLRHGSLMAALAHGLPVVTTQPPPSAAAAGDAFPRLVDGQNALLVPPDDPVQLAKAVTRMMTDDGLRDCMASEAQILARHFEWDTIARQHVEAYQSEA
jgi:glycosyltransferase involved in cell wall biosynthesis